MNIKKSTKYKEGIVRDVTDKFYQNAQNRKMKEDFIKNGIIVEPDWPKLPDYDYTKLMRLVFRFIEELKELEIPFIGVGIDIDFNKPMLVVYISRCARGEPIPLEFEGFKVLSVVKGKYKFK